MNADVMSNTDVRLRCLELAQGALPPGTVAQNAVERAERYLAFVDPPLPSDATARDEAASPAPEELWRLECYKRILYDLLEGKTSMDTTRMAVAVVERKVL